ARRLLGAEGRAGHRPAPALAARARRAAVEERPRPQLRQVPRPGDVPDPRPARARDRLWRPGAEARGFAQIPQLAGDAAVPQGPRALRPVAGAPGPPADPAAGGGGGLYGRGGPV